MIGIIRFNEFLLELKADVNNALLVDDPTFKGKIGDIVISPTELHLTKKISDKKGIVLAVKMADSDMQLDSIDAYSEMNHNLWFIIEKNGPGSQTESQELKSYATYQKIMSCIKDYIMQRGQNGNVCGGDETISETKPFRTEWEYQVYGGFNGISVSFDLQDFGL